MRRTILLFTTLIVFAAASLPFGPIFAEGGKHHKHKRHYKRKHWRRWRRAAWLRRHRAAWAKRRATLLNQRGNATLASTPATDRHVQARTSSAPAAAVPAGLYNLMLPQGWTRTTASAGTTEFAIADNAGKKVGSAKLSKMGLPRVNATSALKSSQTLGSVSFTSMKRVIIDRMMAENGWVINDMERNIGGQKAYVVVAQTTDDKNPSAQPKSWFFYFTEINGQIHSLAINASAEYADKIAGQSEQVLASFTKLNSGQSLSADTK